MDENGPQRPRRGRPAVSAESRKRNNLTMRLRDDTKAALEDAAATHQRSLSEEVEARIEQSLYSAEQALQLAYGPALTGLILTIARAMHEVGRSAGFTDTHSLEHSTNWIREPWPYDQAAEAASAIIESFRPPGDAQPPHHLLLRGLPEPIVNALPNPGHGFAATLLRAIAGESFTREIDEWAKRRRSELGPELVELLLQVQSNEGKN